jgi:hypothetical protein
MRFPASPRARHSQNEMDNQYEQDHDHQIKQLSFVYHNHLPRTSLIKGKRRARSYGFRRDQANAIFQGISVG